MSDTNNEFMAAEGPDVETKQDNDNHAAHTELEDQLRSIRTVEEGKRDAPLSEESKSE